MKTICLTTLFLLSLLSKAQDPIYNWLILTDPAFYSLSHDLNGNNTYTVDFKLVPSKSMYLNIDTILIKTDTVNHTKFLFWNNKQPSLVSGTNIKTVNSNSLLGSGNVSVGDLLSTSSYTNPSWIVSIPYTKVTGISATSPLNYNSGTFSITPLTVTNVGSGNAAISGNTLNIPNTTYTLTQAGIYSALTYTPYNSANPNNYISLTNLSATNPLNYNNATGVFTIQPSSTSQSGVLTSTDWNIFNGKENSITSGTTSQYWRGDKTFQTLDKTAVGLNNVDNTSDVNKPVSTAQQTALNAKQNTLNGTGFAKATGTVITYDNSTYLTGNQTITFTPTGDITGSTTGSTLLTPTFSLATVNSNVGTFGNAASSLTTTVNGKGLITAIGSQSIQITESQVTNLTSDLAAKVTTVTGTSNRITSTGGTTPQIDISSTFENLLGKVANPLSQFASTTSAQLTSVLSDETGSGSIVCANSPTLSSANLDTPTAATLTNCTGLPISTGVSGLGSGIATFLGTPTSSNLAAAVTDETGTVGNLVFSISPLVTNLRTNPNTTAAGSSQIKLTVAGSTVMTTPEIGAIETNTTGALFYTPTTSNRYQIGLVLTGSATLDFPNTASGNASDLTMTVTGAALSDPCIPGVDAASIVPKGTFFCWVSSANTVTVRFQNPADLTARNPASGLFKVTLNKN